ncbi:TPA: class I SAM-dependent methyltransferase [Streptococcus suis]
MVLLSDLLQQVRIIFSIHISYRRIAIDKFYFKHAVKWRKDSVCIDVGGKNKRKKGEFLLSRYIDNPICVNLNPAVEPDYLCDARNMPFGDEYADIIICSEMLEHVDGVDDVLKEIHRVLKTNGRAYICVPFSMHIHSKPYDFGRYTDEFWRQHFTKFGFEVLELEEQGGYWATKINMNKRFLKCFRRRNRYNPFLFGVYLICVMLRMIWLVLECIAPMKEIGYTTGYGIVIKKL